MGKKHLKYETPTRTETDDDTEDDKREQASDDEVSPPPPKKSKHQRKQSNPSKLRRTDSTVIPQPVFHYKTNARQNILDIDFAGLAFRAPSPVAKLKMWQAGMKCGEEFVLYPGGEGTLQPILTPVAFTTQGGRSFGMLAPFKAPEANAPSWKKKPRQSLPVILSAMAIQKFSEIEHAVRGYGLTAFPGAVFSSNIVVPKKPDKNQNIDPYVKFKVCPTNTKVFMGDGKVALDPKTTLENMPFEVSAMVVKLDKVWLMDGDTEKVDMEAEAGGDDLLEAFYAQDEAADADKPEFFGKKFGITLLVIQMRIKNREMLEVAADKMLV